MRISWVGGAVFMGTWMGVDRGCPPGATHLHESSLIHIRVERNNAQGHDRGIRRRLLE
jgi:hypothetical protein